MTEIAITRTTTPKQPPADETLAFGKVFTDHMFMMEYDEGQGWHDPRIVPYAPFTMDPACCVLHYGQAIFDGAKAFRGKDGDTSADGWCFQFCAQVVVTTSQIMWTEEVIQAFDVLNANENAMRECLAKQNTQLDACINLVLNELTWSERIKIITLITIDVHSRDVVQGLIEQRVENPTQFQWCAVSV